MINKPEDALIRCQKDNGPVGKPWLTCDGCSANEDECWELYMAAKLKLDEFRDNKRI